MEMLEIFDENNNSLNYAEERNKVHEQKLWHRHVSAWIMNDKGLILMQKRSLNKKKNPGLWSKTGGHVDYKEEPLLAIKREIFEEIGLEVNNYECIDLFKNDKEKEKYFSYGYIVYTKLKENEFVLQQEEVDSVKYFTIEELEANKDNPQFTFSKWDNEGFNKQMSLLKEYRDVLLNNNYNITLDSLFEKLSNNQEIKNIYKQIEIREKNGGGYAYHNYVHVLNVMDIATKLLMKLDYDYKTILKIKIACLLHDIGVLEGKENHANRSYKYALKLFKNNNWLFEDSDKILDAIKNHSNGFDTDNILTLVIILADKLDIKKTRISELGKTIEGNRQYGHIEDILIDIQNACLIIIFITDKQLNINEFNDYYFTKKVYKAINSFAQEFTLNVNIMVDNKEIKMVL